MSWRLGKRTGEGEVPSKRDLLWFAHGIYRKEEDYGAEKGEEDGELEAGDEVPGEELGDHTV